MVLPKDFIIIVGFVCACVYVVVCYEDTLKRLIWKIGRVREAVAEMKKKFVEGFDQLKMYITDSQLCLWWLNPRSQMAWEVVMPLNMAWQRWVLKYALGISDALDILTWEHHLQSCAHVWHILSFLVTATFYRAQLSKLLRNFWKDFIFLTSQRSRLCTTPSNKSSINLR